jgi:hypothetical protein
MADCYPSDFQGPLPPGGYYCNSPQVPTVFGAINSWVAQISGTAAQIRRTLDTYQGTTQKQPPVQQPTGGHTVLALLLFALAVGVVAWLIVRK